MHDCLLKIFQDETTKAAQGWMWIRKEERGASVSEINLGPPNSTPMRNRVGLHLLLLLHVHSEKERHAATKSLLIFPFHQNIAAAAAAAYGYYDHETGSVLGVWICRRVGGHGVVL